MIDMLIMYLYYIVVVSGIVWFFCLSLLLDHTAYLVWKYKIHNSVIDKFCVIADKQFFFFGDPRKWFQEIRRKKYHDMTKIALDLAIIVFPFGFVNLAGTLDVILGKQSLIKNFPAIIVAIIIIAGVSTAFLYPRKILRM